LELGHAARQWFGERQQWIVGSQAEICSLTATFRLQKPYIKHIEDRLWEMRLRGRGGIARSLYVTASGQRVVILRTFVKKTQKTPRREIELALKRAREGT
jgi:Phage derived protein Gp49-like (DUF891)